MTPFFDIFKPKPTYRNLVFKGGGIRGIAYIGALEVLEEKNMLPNIQRVAGTSAGAITAMLVSLRIPINQVLERFSSLDFTKIPQSSTRERRRFLQLASEEENLERLFKSYGWYSSEYFYNWLQEVVAAFCDGNPNATFLEFKQRGFRDLYIVASNVSRYRGEVFSAKQTPDVAVADAVRMSMSIPLYFEALRFDGKQFGQGDYYVDGGLFNNYPIQLFDQPPFYQPRPNANLKGNPETLGFFLIPDQEGSVNEDKPEPRNIWDFLELVIGNFYVAHQVMPYENSTVDQNRSIAINDCGIRSTDFSIKKGDEKYQLLKEAGEQAARAFLN